ncbi:hypothetical protein V9K67_01810 [Paraflavisolibacter sp. H34]
MGEVLQELLHIDKITDRFLRLEKTGEQKEAVLNLHRAFHKGDPDL